VVAGTSPLLAVANFLGRPTDRVRTYLSEGTNEMSGSWLFGDLVLG
jgi:hypothetical protein